MELVGAEAVIARIEGALGAASPAGAALAFDGDGTLWRGDVGEDFFYATVAAARYSPVAVEAMRAVGRGAGLPIDGDGPALARRLFQAYLARELSEEVICEIIAWGSAGSTESTVARFADEVVAAQRLESRRHRAAGAIVDWARQRGIAVYLVSASPRAVVEAAGRGVGFDREHVLAATPRYSEDGVMLADVVRPIPYGAGKATLLDGKLRGRTLLAAFGDNVFDVPMLEAARIPVVVAPKPRLLAYLEAHPAFQPLELAVER